MENIEVHDLLDLKNNNFIRLMLSNGDGVEDPEILHLSCNLFKFNRWGIRQSRVMIVSNKHLYNLTAMGMTCKFFYFKSFIFN